MHSSEFYTRHIVESVEGMNEYLYLSINFQVTTSILFAKIYTTQHFNWLFVK